MKDKRGWGSWHRWWERVVAQVVGEGRGLSHTAGLARSPHVSHQLATNLYLSTFSALQVSKQSLLE